MWLEFGFITLQTTKDPTGNRLWKLFFCNKNKSKYHSFHSQNNKNKKEEENHNYQSYLIVKEQKYEHVAVQK